MSLFISQVLNILMALPSLLLALAILGVLGPSTTSLLLALSVPAHASLITLSTGFSAAGPLASAAAHTPRNAAFALVGSPFSATFPLKSAEARSAQLVGAFATSFAFEPKAITPQ